MNRILEKTQKCRLWKPTYLTLSGGGGKGAGHLGPLIALPYWNLIDDIQGISGASIGGIIGALWLSGYQGAELANIYCDMDFSPLLKKSNFLNFFENGYLTDGQIIFDLLESLFYDKFKKKNITIQEFYKLTGKEFYMSSVCKEDKCVVYINHKDKEFDQLPLITALKMTSAIPGFFKKVVWKGKTYYDGGFLDNYPTTVFPPDKTLGIRLGVLGQKSSGLESIDQSAFPKMFRVVIDVIEQLTWTVILMADEIERLRGKELIREICIDIGDTNTFSINMTPDKKIKIVLSGVASTLKWLKTLDYVYE